MGRQGGIVRLLPVLVALAAAGSGAQAAEPATAPTAFKINVQGGFYVGYHTAVAIRRTDAGWVAERRHRVTMGPDGETKSLEHGWADSRACPELNRIVGEIPDLSRLKKDTQPPPFHGLRAHVATLPPGGKPDHATDYEGPVMRWWRDAEKRLAPCWRAEPATIAGAPLPPLLATDADERAFAPLPSEW